MDLEVWIDVGALSTGRRLFALEEMKGEAQALGENEDVVARIDEATAHDEHTRDLEGLWGGVRAGNLDSVNMGAVDARLDKVISAVRDGAEAQRQGAPDDDPIHETVDTFLKTAMPEGVYAITSLPYVDQLSATQKLLATLRGPLAGTVSELGLTRPVNLIAQILPEYRAGLHGPGGLGVTFVPVREARLRGRRYLREIVALIVGRYNRDEDPVHRAARERLLTPLLKQVQAARALRGRRSGNGAEPVAPADPAQPGDAQPGEQSAV